MAKTVEEGFRSFHDDRLTQNTTETDAAKSHRATLEASLKATFAITRFFRTGSVGNGTGVRHHSDIDYFASIPAGHQRANSDTMLRVMRDVLNDRFSRTDVVVRTPAVLVPFGRDGSESTEIIPAKYIEKDKAGNLVYGIANGSGTWMRSSPDAHNGYVASIRLIAE